MSKTQPHQRWFLPRTPFVCFVSFVVATWCVSAAEPLQLPPETAKFKLAPGYEIVSAVCVICHSPDYVATQPRLPRSFWTAEIEKMRKTYGAPIQDNQVQPILDYLVKNYGKENDAK